MYSMGIVKQGHVPPCQILFGVQKASSTIRGPGLCCRIHSVKLVSQFGGNWFRILMLENNVTLIHQRNDM